MVNFVVCRHTKFGKQKTFGEKNVNLTQILSTILEVDARLVTKAQHLPDSLSVPHSSDVYINISHETGLCFLSPYLGKIKKKRTESTSSIHLV